MLWHKGNTIRVLEKATISLMEPTLVRTEEPHKSQHSKASDDGGSNCKGSNFGREKYQILNAHQEQMTY